MKESEFREFIGRLIGEVPLSSETVEQLLSILVRFPLKKYQVFLKEGEVCNYMSLVTSGLVRLFYYKDNREITEFFASEDTLFVSLESYFKREPSRIIIEALEPSVLYSFPYDEFENLCKTNAQVEHMYRKMLEGSLIISQHRLDSLQFETAHERYQRLLRDIPSIVLRVPSVYIASYLGITPETLSRVRSKME